MLDGILLGTELNDGTEDGNTLKVGVLDGSLLSTELGVGVAS